MGLFSFGKSNEEKASHLHHKGVNLSKKGKFEEALECFNEATVLDSWKTRWEAWFCKGQVLSHLGRYEETFDCFNEAISIDSTNPDFWTWKSFALKKLGRHEEAEQCVAKAKVIEERE